MRIQITRELDSNKEISTKNRNITSESLFS
ncbi:hypothetical protein LSS_21245 [Leptospira santarosai serovar Shermani str. LT 821]|uniref:Uncharacterized protein n=1 Tax=Leptospira santarosai serovar Shermani str. LT 821 TaxID=758847 RepID=A0A097ESE8_9LEPT|nr:hypothetical protein LSS_21245 [Leptospira santarosai serovar Shermani str. LT 821]